ncbi:MAG: hypothetical protein B6I20_00960 [Bacteroidetes bacterium 4572_117]|nr:MAG: hypothetical protein B6I20_00960 [Bacteroidetes bacterium 4572_117]
MTEHSNKPKYTESFLFKDKSAQNLILYNDDFNEFDFVVETLMKICEHNQEQAHQCALIAHLKGKSSVKTGSSLYLKPMKDALVDKGLTASIE